MNRVALSFAFAALAVVSTPAFAEDPAWTAKVKKLLASRQSYPEAAQARGDEGTATVKISVAADGKLQAVELLQPSGSRLLDREAVTLPSKIGAFPAPGSNASLVVPMTWKLH